VYIYKYIHTYIHTNSGFYHLTATAVSMYTTLQSGRRGSRRKRIICTRHPSPALKQLYITAKWTRTIYLATWSIDHLYASYNLVHCCTVLNFASLFLFFLFSFFLCGIRVLFNLLKGFGPLHITYLYTYIVHTRVSEHYTGCSPPLRSSVGHMVRAESLLPTLYLNVYYIIIT